MDIKLPTQEEIHDAYQAGEEAVQRLFATVSARVEQLASHLQELHEVIHRLPKAKGLKKVWLFDNSRKMVAPPYVAAHVAR